MAESVCEASSTSIHHRSQQLNIFHKDLGMKPIDHPMRIRFAKCACDRLTEDADFGKKNIFSDEAHFDLGRYVNKKSCSIWRFLI